MATHSPARRPVRHQWRSPLCPRHQIASRMVLCPARSRRRHYFRRRRCRWSVRNTPHRNIRLDLTRMPHRLCVPLRPDCTAGQGRLTVDAPHLGDCNEHHLRHCTARVASASSRTQVRCRPEAATVHSPTVGLHEEPSVLERCKLQGVEFT